MSNREPIRCAYNVFEPRQGIKDEVPIIFLHGITASKEYWGDIPQFVANYTGKKAYSLDARNHGDSEWSDLFDFQINADDLLCFMDDMKIPKAVLVGHSMGGVTAMKTALLKPERVHKLIVEDMSTGPCPQSILNPSLEYLNLAKEAVRQIPPGSRMDFAKKFISNYAFENLPEKLKILAKYESNDPRLILRKKADGNYEFKCNLDLIIEIIKSANSYLTKYEGLYNGQACFIYGEKSPFLVGESEECLLEHFPNIQMICIKNAQHNVHFDFVLPFVEVLLDFLKERK